jgi:hypothetical protein
MRDRAMQAFINYTSTSDREALSQAIKGYEYLAAHLHLGKHMHALCMIDETHIKWISCLIIRHDRSLRSQSVLHVRDENYQPAVTSIIETLTESIQASNAPSAAIPAATCSI